MHESSIGATCGIPCRGQVAVLASHPSKGTMGEAALDVAVSAHGDTGGPAPDHSSVVYELKGDNALFPRLTGTTNSNYTAQITVESKGYITVRVAKDPRATNLYWQLVDPKFSLLELGFESPSGRLVHCSVPLFNGEVEDRRNESVPTATTGVPLFDLSPWPLRVTAREVRGNHLEQAGRIRLVSKDGGLSILSDETIPARNILYAEKLICGFSNSDELVAITLVGSYQLLGRLGEARLRFAL